MDRGCTRGQDTQEINEGNSEEYGFDHIGIFVAQVKETKKGREKQLDLSGQMHQLKTYEATKNSNGLPTVYEHLNWGYRKEQDDNEKIKTKFVKQTTDKKLKSAETKGKSSIFHESHGKIWQAGKNDCKTLVDAMGNALWAGNEFLFCIEMAVIYIVLE